MMKHQKGSALVISLSVLAIVVALVFTLLVSYITNYNYGNRAEQGIKASWEDNKNILSNYSLKVQEIAQVPAIYKNDLREVFTDVMAGRYGTDGSQAVFQFIQEQNPNFDSAIYTKIQQVMEAGRNEFRVAQTQLIDQKRSYSTRLGSFWSGFWLRVAGFPTVSLDEYNIVTSKHANATFESGVDEGIKIQ